jgi:hypothetical protein
MNSSKLGLNLEQKERKVRGSILFLDNPDQEVFFELVIIPPAAR